MKATKNKPRNTQTTVKPLANLAKKMLSDTPLVDAWRINFFANFYTGPIYRELSNDFDLSRPEFVVLFCLSQMSNITAKDICEATGLPKNSISRGVADLLKKKLIVRESREHDRRSKTLVMTKKANLVLDEVIQRFFHRQEQMFALLTKKEREQLNFLMKKLTFDLCSWAKPY